MNSTESMLGLGGRARARDRDRARARDRARTSLELGLGLGILNCKRGKRLYFRNSAAVSWCPSGSLGALVVVRAKARARARI